MHYGLRGEPGRWSSRRWRGLEKGGKLAFVHWRSQLCTGHRCVDALILTRSANRFSQRSTSVPVASILQWKDWILNSPLYGEFSEVHVMMDGIDVLMLTYRAILEVQSVSNHSVRLSDQITEHQEHKKSQGTDTLDNGNGNCITELEDGDELDVEGQLDDGNNSEYDDDSEDEDLSEEDDD
jgi:hypothetical protein